MIILRLMMEKVIFINTFCPNVKKTNENERAILQIYAAMELDTVNVFNSFKEANLCFLAC
ncbi:hypothetical protein ANABIO32_23830 [Rossellomorea marisflavi]|nr:hypothetical protein ANABIO32_23830 [Rossellomorea marisflavi]